MKSYFGYTRVSTAKQGAQGVSLIEQKSAIERYAAKNGFAIVEWFEERETAAKRGRPVFSRMLALLRRGKAAGVIIHKIDRSARNLKDWADLGEMIDAGVELHFAADALDLNSRGGRLSADIQAVVAADYIRNLREETRKGFYGRLKQGLYPLGAPVGYLDQGGGKPKIPDPATAPFVRQAFELYATRAYSLHALRDELVNRGFRRSSSRSLQVSSLSHLLNNPFYTGVIRLKTTGETFRGVHEPLVSVAMYERVQSILKGKLVHRVVTHDFTYRRLFSCGLCGGALIGERQKGRIYYRCHTKDCETAGVREDALSEAVNMLLHRVELTPDEVTEAKEYLARKRGEGVRRDAEAALTLQVASARSRLDRLTDAFVDGLIEKPVFEERRTSLVSDLARLEGNLADVDDHLARKQAEVARTLELAENLVLGYETARPAKKREILESMTSNRTLSGKNLEIRLRIPFEALARRPCFQLGAPHRCTPRTSETCARRREAVFAVIDNILDDDGKPAKSRAKSATSTKSTHRRDV